MNFKKIPFIMMTMFFTAVGIHLMVIADLGLNPWWSFTTGLHEATGIPLGLMVQIFGLILIGSAYVLGMKPGIVTLLDMFLIGFYLDLLSKLPSFSTNSIIVQFILCIAGLFVLSLGLALTVSQNLGAGPKDSFTLAIARYFNKGFGNIKLIIECVTFALGIIVGGPFGIGTILATLLTGKLMNVIFHWIGFDPLNKQKTVALS